MAYSPYIANVESWKHEFTQPNHHYKPFYTLKNNTQHGEKMDPIKLVTPTEQAVDRAKSVLRENQQLESILPRIKRTLSRKRKQSSTKSSVKRTKNKKKTSSKTKKSFRK